jgi:LssY C-terminus
MTAVLEAKRHTSGAARSCLWICAAATGLAGCAATAFQPGSVDPSALADRTITQTDNGVTVTAYVPSAEEFEQLSGVDVYSDGIQPVWLRVENGRDLPVRVAYTSMDAEYYSPLEVAWDYRKGFRKDARADFERWIHESGMPRGIAAGDTRSGFVYTHAVEGTKGFNVDVYAATNSAHFTFFVPLPGFAPDYMNVEFETLYDADEVRTTTREGLREAVASLPCCTTDESGQGIGDPLNVVLVGTGNAVRRSLLRGGWQETESGSVQTRLARMHRFRGRPPDGTFHWTRPDGTELKELRLWLAPLRVGELPVWIGQANYEMSGSLFTLKRSQFQTDPDVDDARMFVLQNFWYGQSLDAFAMARGGESVSIDAQRTDFDGQRYFTDGLRAVMFVAEDPIGMDDTEILFWEPFVAR